MHEEHIDVPRLTISPVEKSFQDHKKYSVGEKGV